MSIDGQREDFYAWSQVVWAKIDALTWEILQEVQHEVASLVEVQTSGNIQSVVGDVSKIGKWGERKVQTLLNGVRKVQDVPFDFAGQWVQVEVKTAAVGNASIIKTNQLQEFARLTQGDKYYALVFYKTRDGEKVMHSRENLEERLIVEEIFVFPLEYIIYYFNTSGRKKIQIRSGNLNDTFVKIHRTAARSLYALDTGNVFLKRDITAWGKQVHIVEYCPRPLAINKTFT